MDIQKLIQIAEDLNLHDKVQELKFYVERLSSPDKDLILPLVGEFSSGKTTLINSLLDNPNLETASRATTASIFEIHFGADECYAEIHKEDGYIDSVKDVIGIKNEDLKQVDVVKVYDTSTKIGASTILVDTPGLSSNDPAHRIALSSYLPNADAILLLTDVNQQITRSLMDFIGSSKLANKPIYLIVTKCDTKTQNEVENAISYIKKNIDFTFERIVPVSVVTGQMSQFDELINNIQNNKNAIVEKSINERIKNVAKEMSLVVSDLLKQGNSTSDIDAAIQEEEKKLKKINHNIDSLISEAEDRVEDRVKHALSQFSKTIFSQVDDIIKTQGRDCSDSVNSVVNSTAVMLMQNFQKDVMSDILSLARMRQNGMEEVPMGVLETVNMTENAFNGFSSGVDLSNVGHKFDKKIGYGVIGALTVAAVVVAAAGGAAAAGTATGTAVEGTIATGTVIAADAATDVAATAYTANKINKLSKMAKVAEKAKVAKQYIDDFNENFDTVKKYDQNIGEKSGMNRGIIETSVGWVTEFFAKPARQRAVNNYIDGTLIPEFRLQIQSVSSNLLREITSLLRQEAANSCGNIRANLQSLKSALNEKKEEYAQKIKTYKQYIIQLNEI